MKQIKYSYCIDDDNNLIHVLSLTNSTRHSRKLYCLQCGQEMVANLGTKKSWYFSHKSDCACDGESYYASSIDTMTFTIVIFVFYISQWDSRLLAHDRPWQIDVNYTK